MSKVLQVFFSKTDVHPSIWHIRKLVREGFLAGQKIYESGNGPIGCWSNDVRWIAFGPYVDKKASIMAFSDIALKYATDGYRVINECCFSNTESTFRRGQPVDRFLF
jgi:hypothetical protein